MSSATKNKLHTRLLQYIHLMFGKLYSKVCSMRGKLQKTEKSLISVIYKKGSKTDPGNYMPISLTSTMRKVMEALLRDEIMPHMKSTTYSERCSMASYQDILQSCSSLRCWTNELRS